jgi:putative hydrolase of HD superfamily
LKGTAEKIYGFMDVIEQLCHVRRDIYRRDGVKESDSDHIMKLSLLLLLVLPYIKQPVDARKVLELALVHDLAESDAGDTPRLQSDHSPEIKAMKKIRETEAIQKYRDALPEPIGRKIFDLFAEYEERKTPEAKLVKAFDKFEGDMQALKENKGLRFYQDGRYKFILNYLKEDLDAAENEDEPLMVELQKLQLALAQNYIDELLADGSLERAGDAK